MHLLYGQESKAGPGEVSAYLFTLAMATTSLSPLAVPLLLHWHGTSPTYSKAAKAERGACMLRHVR